MNGEKKFQKRWKTMPKFSQKYNWRLKLKDKSRKKCEEIFNEECR